MPGVEVNALKVNEQQEKRTIVLILTILTSIVLLILIDGFIAKVVHEPVLDKAYIQREVFFPFDSFRPEAVERTQFIADVILYPILCLLFFLLYSRLMPKLRSMRRWLYYAYSLSVLIFLAFIANKGLSEVVSGSYLYIHSSILFYRPILTIGLVLMTLIAVFVYEKMVKQPPAWIKTSGRVMYYLIGLGLLILIATETIFNEAEPNSYVQGLHFLAVFGPVQRVFMGGKLLVNVNSEYGLFPLFLKPVFRLVGLSVLNFTLLMGILKLISFGSLFMLLSKII